MIFKDLEDYIHNNFRPIELYEWNDNTNQIGELFIPPDDTFQEFIYSLIYNYTYNFVTCIKEIPKQIDTPLKCHRSVGDIYLLTKNYFPQITLFDVIDELVKKANELVFYSLYCSNIEKITFFKPGSRGYGNPYEKVVKLEKTSVYDNSYIISKDLNCTFEKLIKLYNNEKNNTIQTTNQKQTSESLNIEIPIAFIPF